MLKNLNIFRPVPYVNRPPQEKIHPQYKKLRWQVFIGVTIGYMGFYLVRNNFILAIPYLLQQGFTKTQLGIIFSTLPLAYSLSKLIMGAISDHSNPRYFMASGLFFS